VLRAVVVVFFVVRSGGFEGQTGSRESVAVGGWVQERRWAGHAGLQLLFIGCSFAKLACLHVSMLLALDVASGVYVRCVWMVERSGQMCEGLAHPFVVCAVSLHAGMPYCCSFMTVTRPCYRVPSKAVASAVVRDEDRSWSCRVRVGFVSKHAGFELPTKVLYIYLSGWRFELKTVIGYRILHNVPLYSFLAVLLVVCGFSARSPNLHKNKFTRRTQTFE
jgi:hypothetical protein